MDDKNAELWKHLVINQQEVISLQRQFMAHQSVVTKELSDIKDILAQAKGSWKTLVAIAGVMAAMTGAAAWVWINIFHLGK